MPSLLEAAQNEASAAKEELQTVTDALKVGMRRVESFFKGLLLFGFRSPSGIVGIVGA